MQNLGGDCLKEFVTRLSHNIVNYCDNLLGSKVMRKLLIKIVLIYCATFAILAIVLRLSPSMHIWHEYFATAANITWIVIPIRTAYKIRKESLKTKLSIFGYLFAVQLVLGLLFVEIPLFVSTENIMLGVFVGIAISTTVFVTFFAVIRSIKSKKTHVKVLKFCLYIIFFISIPLVMGTIGYAITDGRWFWG